MAIQDSRPPTIALFQHAHGMNFREATFNTAGGNIIQTHTLFCYGPVIINTNEGDRHYSQQVPNPFQSSPDGRVLGAASVRPQIPEVTGEWIQVSAPNDTDTPQCYGDVLATISGGSGEDRKAKTPAEVYTRGMLVAGLGLACWHPVPHPQFAGDGAVLGDVGTFNLTDGFRTVFNIWKHEPFRQRLVASPGTEPPPPPPQESKFYHDKLAGGHTIVDGASSLDFGSVSQDERAVGSFEFHFESEQGAVLACPTSADLEELVHPIALRDFLVQHAGAVYEHARAHSTRPLGDEESLYIVSGCIRSDTWALAAFNSQAEPSNNVLRLEKSRAGNVPAYIWTQRGTAEARSGSTSVPESPERHRRKDQCLFLRGFKLRARSPSSSEQGSIPSADPTFFHPCDQITNELLLERTSASYALSHEDDWTSTPHLDNSSWDGETCSKLLRLEDIRTRNGVAYLPLAGETGTQPTVSEDASSPEDSLNPPPTRHGWWKAALRRNASRPGGASPQSPSPPSPTGLYESGVTAWYEYIKDNNDLPALVNAVEAYSIALDSAPKGHHLRNGILIALTFALLEQDNDQQGLEKIEAYLWEIECWDELERPDARAIASKLAKAYRKLGDLGSSLSYSIKAQGYSDDAVDQVLSYLDVVYICRRKGERYLERATKAADSAKHICPSDRPDLLLPVLVARFTLYKDGYRGSGSWEDLKNAIAEGEAALLIEMPPARRLTMLIDVAQCICVLYSNIQSSESGPETSEERMRDAIRYARRAVELANGDERFGVHLDIILAGALSSSYANPTVEELDEAIALFRKATEQDLEVSAGLAGAICYRCEKGGEVAETDTTLECAVRLYGEVLAASKDTDWNSRIANNLACIYVAKAQLTGDVADYEKANQNYQRAAEMCVNPNDKGYYEEQAGTIQKVVAKLQEETSGGLGSAGGSPQESTQELQPEEGTTRGVDGEGETVEAMTQKLQEGTTQCHAEFEGGMLQEAKGGVDNSERNLKVITFSVILCLIALFLFYGKPDSD